MSRESFFLAPVSCILIWYSRLQVGLTNSSSLLRGANQTQEENTARSFIVFILILHPNYFVNAKNVNLHHFGLSWLYPLEKLACSAARDLDFILNDKVKYSREPIIPFRQGLTANLRLASPIIQATSLALDLSGRIMQALLIRGSEIQVKFAKHPTYLAASEICLSAMHKDAQGSLH